MPIRILLCTGLVALVLAALPAAHAAGWATDDAGVLYQVFPLSKEVDRVGVIQATVTEAGRTWTETPSLTDLALHDVHGMYGITYTHLYRIDLVDPSRSVRIGALGGGFAVFNALAFDGDGTLYALGGGTIYEIDRQTGRAKKLGSLGGVWTSDGDLAWVDDALHATVNGALGCHLVRLEPKTWKVTDLGRIQTRTNATVERASSTTRAETMFDDVWGLIWDGRTLWGLTPAGEVLEIERKTATATPRYRVRATFWGACAMLRI